jgi:hypothetical protein
VKKKKMFATDFKLGQYKSSAHNVDKGNLPTAWLLLGNLIAGRDKIRVTSVATANKDTSFDPSCSTNNLTPLPLG